MAREPDAYIKAGDRLPPLRIILKDANGAVVDGSVGTVTFNMVNRYTGEAVVAAGATVANDADQGDYQYEWAAGETDDAGLYLGEFVLTLTSGGKTQTFPNDGDILIQIAPDRG